MNANVRCVGLPPEYQMGQKVEDETQPCGWQGERLGRPTKVNGEIHWNLLTIPDDPCPRCGGRVELIPQEVNGP